jgi:hypothetical protein
MLGLYGGEDLDVICNTVIFISKLEIWKIRNKMKYNQSRIGDKTVFRVFFLHHNIVYSKSPVYNNLNGPGVNIKCPSFSDCFLTPIQQFSSYVMARTR